MPAPDYFPLIAGRILEYRDELEAGSSWKLEILKTSATDKRTSARCRWTAEGPRGKRSWKTTLSRDGSWMRRGELFLPIPAETLFPIPAAVGKKWRYGRWEYEVASLDAQVDLGPEAGVPTNISGCLLVAWHFDEGSGENYYAPGIGLVKAASNDEQYPFSLLLRGFSDK